MVTTVSEERELFNYFGPKHHDFNKFTYVFYPQDRVEIYRLLEKQDSTRKLSYVLSNKGIVHFEAAAEKTLAALDKQSELNRLPSA